MKHVAVAAALVLAAGLACAAARDQVSEEVIVEGTRPEVERRASTFVRGEPDALLKGWRKRAPRLFGKAPPDTKNIGLGALSDYVVMVGLTDVASGSPPAKRSRSSHGALPDEGAAASAASS